MMQVGDTFPLPPAHLSCRRGMMVRSPGWYMVTRRSPYFTGPELWKTMPQLTLVHPYKHLMVFYFAEEIKARELSNLSQVTGVGNGCFP